MPLALPVLGASNRPSDVPMVAGEEEALRSEGQSGLGSLIPGTMEGGSERRRAQPGRDRDQAMSATEAELSTLGQRTAFPSARAGVQTTPGLISAGLVSLACGNQLHAPWPAIVLDSSVGLGSVPFVSMIRSLIESERLLAARSLTALALQTSSASTELLELGRVLGPAKVARKPSRDIARGREYAWLRQYGRAYRGQWVALDGDRLVGTGGSLRELLAKLEGLGLARSPLVHRCE